MKRVFLFWCLGAATLFAQSTAMGSRTVEGDWDASGAKTTKPAKTGTVLPATCSAGEAFFKTDAAGGQNLYLCKPDNAWTQVSGGGGGGVTHEYLVFDGSTTNPGDGSTLTWSCGTGSGATCTTNWTVPAGVNWVGVQLWGAGSGGTGGEAGNEGGIGGSGGGYYEIRCTVTPLGTVNVVVGVGGLGSTGRGWNGAGGNSSFGSCVIVSGGGAQGDGAYTAGWPGTLGATPFKVGYMQFNSGYFNSPACVRSDCLGPNANDNDPGSYATRPDQGGAGANGTASSGEAGAAGGPAIGGGGGGGGGSYNNATGGTGGASQLGGVGGNGGACVTATCSTACTNGSIPGGGGGGNGVRTSGSSTSGCNGARGEVRVYYVK